MSVDRSRTPFDRLLRVPGDPQAPLLADVVSDLERAQLTVAAAESLTGGLFIAALTSVPGSSVVVRGGLTVYATELKASLAMVDRGLLDRVGPVHPEVATALADGARVACGATIGIGLTGVAGPEPQAGQPVGQWYAALSTVDARGVVASQVCSPGSGIRRSVEEAAEQRHRIRIEATVGALQLLRSYLDDGLR